MRGKGLCELTIRLLASKTRLKSLHYPHNLSNQLSESIQAPIQQSQQVLRMAKAQVQPKAGLDLTHIAVNMLSSLHQRVSHQKTHINEQLQAFIGAVLEQIISGTMNPTDGASILGGVCGLPYHVQQQYQALSVLIRKDAQYPYDVWISLAQALANAMKAAPAEADKKPLIGILRQKLNDTHAIKLLPIQEVVSLLNCIQRLKESYMWNNTISKLHGRFLGVAIPPTLLIDVAITCGKSYLSDSRIWKSLAEQIFQHAESLPLEKLFLPGLAPVMVTLHSELQQGNATFVQALLKQVKKQIKVGLTLTCLQFLQDCWAATDADISYLAQHILPHIQAAETYLCGLRHFFTQITPHYDIGIE